MLKKLAAILCALVFVFGFVACGSREGSENGGNGDDGKPQTVTVWWTGSTAQQNAINRAKELYEAEHKNITISVSPMSADDFYTTYALSLKGNSCPDVALLDSVYIQTLAYYSGAGNQIANLSKELPAEELNDLSGRFFQTAWNTSLYKGDAYAIPFSLNTFGLAYNKTLMAKVLNHNLGTNYTADNIPAEYIPETLADIQKFYPMLKSYRQKYGNAYYTLSIPSGVGSTSTAAMEYVSLVARLGGKIMSDDLKTVTIYNDSFASDKAANVRAAEVLYDFGSEETVLGEYKEANFEGGDILFMVAGCWKQSYYKTLATNENNKQEFGWTDLVTLDGKKENSATVGVYSLVATQKSKVKSEAIKFMKWLATNKEVQLLYAEKQDLLPSVKAFTENNEFYATDAWQVFVKGVEGGVTRPATPAWSTCATYCASLLSNLLTHNMKIDSSNCTGYEDMLSKVQTKLATAVSRVN